MTSIGAAYSAIMKRLLTVLAAVALLAGCGSSGGGAGPSSAASTPPSAVRTVPTVSAMPSSAAPTTTALASTAAPKDATYSTVVELRDAAIAAGYQCPQWVEDDQVANAAESGNCSDSDVFAIYASGSSRDAQVAQSKQNNQTLIGAGIEPAYVLFGANWSINAPKTNIDTIRSSLGGIETH